MAEIVGASGKVVAVEIETDLAARATARQMIERRLDSIAKELGGHADGFGAFGDAEGE
jgi:hypothetical protein